VPFAQVANFGPGERAIDAAKAAGNLLLTNADCHERLALPEIHPGLEAVPSGLTNDREAAAVVKEQIGAVEIAALREGIAHVPAQRAWRTTGSK
jgi:hypothetical protein